MRLSRSVQLNEPQLENHQVNQTVGGAELQLYKTTCCTGESVSNRGSTEYTDQHEAVCPDLVLSVVWSFNSSSGSKLELRACK